MKQPVPEPPLTEPERDLGLALAALKTGRSDEALLIAAQMKERYAGTVWHKRALFLSLRAYVQANRTPEAVAAVLELQAVYPELADYALFLLAEHHFGGRRYSEAAALSEQLTVRYPKSSLASRAQFQQARALFESLAYAQAAETFAAFLKSNPRSDLAPAAGLGLGRALLYEADLAASIRAYQDVWMQYPGAPNDQDVKKALAELRAGGADIPAATADELYERGRNLFRAGQYELAVEAFKSYLNMEKNSARRPDALYRTGVSLFNLGRRSEAVAVLEKAARDYPGDPKAAESLYWLGKSYSKLGEWNRGLKAFQKILDSYPDSDWADDALFLSGNICRESGDMKKALSFYGRLAQEYPDSRFADSALWWRAWSYYTAGDLKKADQGMQELVRRYPRSFLAGQALYWEGKIAEKKGDAARANAMYERVLKQTPFTYYGHRAGERKAALAKSGSLQTVDDAADVIAACSDAACADDPLSSYDMDDGPPVWTEETRRLLAADPVFRKTLELMHQDMKKEASAELGLLQDRIPKKRGMLIGLSKAYFELGDYHRSLMLVLRNYERFLESSRTGISDDLWLLAYPQGYWDSIVTYARKYGQDPFFIAAIIREESQFRLDALSPAGARGLMQVMPATGEWAAQLNKMTGFDRDRLFESDTGINIGTWYVSHLMKKFRNDPLLVAAAYNAGPEPVLSWISRNGYHGERDAFVELIPYTETRGYVKKVLRNYAEYRRIYGKNGTAEFATRIMD